MVWLHQSHGCAIPLTTLSDSGQSKIHRGYSQSMSIGQTVLKSRTWATAAVVACALLLAACGGSSSTGSTKVGVALILKNFTNPFFVSMQNDAKTEAGKVGVSLTVSAGTKDGDTATQITSIENAISAGNKGILITPNGPGVNAAIKKARDAGLYVIALDTPPDPPSTVDITFATDNLQAGVLIGKWAAAQLLGKKRQRGLFNRRTRAHLLQLPWRNRV